MTDLNYTFTSDPMPKGRFANRNKTEAATKKAQEQKRRRGLPKHIVTRLTSCRWQEPATDHPECTTLLYRRVCPVEECDYLSGRYISHESALKALLGHLRWVHNYG